jgi:pyruvate/2-oxoacid:ferredoxin oxidoreductase beta subunit
MPPKNMPLIMAAHEIPYVATATMGYPEDYARKIRKAMTVKDGMAYIHLFSPCTTGWRARPESGVEICRKAVETNIFPLWEYERGTYRFTQRIKKTKPVTDYFKLMQKFNHLNEGEMEEFQDLVDRRYDNIRSLTERASDLEC